MENIKEMAMGDAYYLTRTIFRNNYDDKADIFINEYEIFNVKINNAVNKDVIREEMTIDHDTIMDITDNEKEMVFSSYLLKTYLKTVKQIYEYNIKCHQLISFKLKSKLSSDIIDNIVINVL